MSRRSPTRCACWRTSSSYKHTTNMFMKHKNINTDFVLTTVVDDMIVLAIYLITNEMQNHLCILVSEVAPRDIYSMLFIISTCMQDFADWEIPRDSPHWWRWPSPRLTRYTNFLALRLRSPGTPARTQPPCIPPAAERRSYPIVRLLPRSYPHPRHFHSCSQTRPTVAKPAVNPQLFRVFRGPSPTQPVARRS